MSDKTKNRLTNVYMYLGMVSTILLATGLDIAYMSTWKELVIAICGIFLSPAKLLCMSLAILSAIIDPTTIGLRDGKKNTQEVKIQDEVQEEYIFDDMKGMGEQDD